MQNRFISDCLIHDRTDKGTRIRMARRFRLPEYIKFFDDELDMLFIARVVWQKGNEAGVLFADGDDGRRVSGRAHAAFHGKYYATNPHQD